MSREEDFNAEYDCENVPLFNPTSEAALPPSAASVAERRDLTAQHDTEDVLCLDPELETALALSIAPAAEDEDMVSAMQRSQEDMEFQEALLRSI